jgi:hypothetical protein
LNGGGHGCARPLRRVQLALLLLYAQRNAPAQRRLERGAARLSQAPVKLAGQNRAAHTAGLLARACSVSCSRMTASTRMRA